MFSAAAKYGLAGAMSLAGISGGYTMKEVFWADAPANCISANTEQDGHVTYRNHCERTINALVCENYNYSFSLFGNGRGLKACFRKSFHPHEIYVSQNTGDAPSGISIKECISPREPQFTGEAGECPSNYY